MLPTRVDQPPHEAHEHEREAKPEKRQIVPRIQPNPNRTLFLLPLDILHLILYLKHEERKGTTSRQSSRQRTQERYPLLSISLPPSTARERPLMTQPRSHDRVIEVDDGSKNSAEWEERNQIKSRPKTKNEKATTAREDRSKRRHVTTAKMKKKKKRGRQKQK
ncbi:hypothetical protein BDZ97DRAFT_512630 [Flammula alnicola]|nr:hypothetical protein BDZ97DRAFT_512630 [Flammula alnicola]